jgi:DNA repair photolyase
MEYLNTPKDPHQDESQYADALAVGPVRGRGAGINPGNRFESVRLHVLGEELDERLRERPEGTQVGTQVFADKTKSVITRNDSPDLHFDWTLNPYRGCEHGCIYCYARPGHEYLGLSSGLDFETKLFAKLEAPKLLRKELSAKSWRGEPIMMAGVTDIYQPIEKDLQLTRRCLEVMLEFGQPVSVITKNHLITRDVDILSALAREGLVHAAVSITTLDAKLSAAMEPRASSPASRLDAVRTLAKAGVPVAVMNAPIIPGLNDHETPAVLRESRAHGAIAAGYILLRLPHQVKALFLEWLSREFPDRAAKVESLIRQTRLGGLYDPAFRTRQRGEGEVAENIARMFHLFRRKYKLDERLQPHNRERFGVQRAPALREAPDTQLALF